MMEIPDPAIAYIGFMVGYMYRNLRRFARYSTSNETENSGGINIEIVKYENKANFVYGTFLGYFL